MVWPTGRRRAYRCAHVTTVVKAGRAGRVANIGYSVIVVPVHVVFSFPFVSRRDTCVHPCHHTGSSDVVTCDSHRHITRRWASVAQRWCRTVVAIEHQGGISEKRGQRYTELEGEESEIHKDLRPRVGKEADPNRPSSLEQRNPLPSFTSWRAQYGQKTHANTYNTSATIVIAIKYEPGHRAVCFEVPELRQASKE